MTWIKVPGEDWVKSDAGYWISVMFASSRINSSLMCTAWFPVPYKNPEVSRTHVCYELLGYFRSDDGLEQAKQACDDHVQGVAAGK